MLQALGALAELSCRAQGRLEMWEWHGGACRREPEGEPLRVGESM